MGVGRQAAIGTCLCVTTAVVTQILHADFISGLPAQQVALETTGSLVTLLAGFLVFGRMRRNSRLTELALATALAVIMLSNVLFVMLPLLMGQASANSTVWAAIIGRSAGSLLFAVAAFVPPVRLRRPGRAQGLAATGVIVILVLTAVLPRVFGSGLPLAVTHTGDGLHANPALTAVQIVAAVLAVAAAAGYLRRAERLADEFSGWLAVAAIFATASHVNYAFTPTIYSSQVSLGDIFRFCFYVVLLAGSMREIWSYWRALAAATVAEERRRFARDLSSQHGAVDEETLRQLRASVDRARLASRQAIDMVAAPGRPALADALTEAAGAVAERFGLSLSLDLASGIGMAPARADALVRIACEALTNVARHSGSRQVSLILRREGGRVRMRVRDSGHGFDTAAYRGGFGLTSMSDRARSVGGELSIISEPGAGSQVEATL